MKIEIFSRDVDKKAEILTFLRNAGDFESSGGKASAGGIEAEITGRYILICTGIPWMADDLIRKLLTVRPVNFATGFYEIVGDARAIITCPAKKLRELIPAVELLEHLDLEAGELAGRFRTKWSSRDVSLAAHYELMVQGGVAVARVKFLSHFRETEQNCRNVVNMAGLSAGIAAFSAEAGGLARPAAVSPVALTASSLAGSQAGAAFLNLPAGRAAFMEESREYLVYLDGSVNRVHLKEKAAETLEASVYMETPWMVDDKILAGIGEILEISLAEAGMSVDGLTLSPHDLITRLGFSKEREFTSFRYREGDIEVLYDIGIRRLRVWTVIPWDRVGGSRDIFQAINDIAGRVMGFAC